MSFAAGKLFLFRPGFYSVVVEFVHRASILINRIAYSVLDKLKLKTALRRLARK